MPKIANFGGGAKNAELDLDDSTFYDGPVPPKGVYRGKLKRLALKKNKNGDWMFNGVVEINETSRHKKQYNGYGAWFNQNITESGAPFVNAFLDALGLSKAQKKAFWGSTGVKTETGDSKDGPHPVEAIGGFRVKEEMPIVFLGKRDSYNGEERLQVGRFLVADQVKSSDDVDDETDIDEDEDVIDDDFDDEEDEEDDEEVDDAELVDEDDEDEEPEPPRKATSKAKRSSKADDDNPPF